MKRILIIGATSAIAEATARQFIAHNCHFYLVARHKARLSALAKDLKVRGASHVDTATLDVNQFEAHETVIKNAITSLGGLDMVLIAHGALSDQKACEQSFEKTRDALNTNAISVISLLTHVANYFEVQEKGSIVVISSVAGDRGRASNYIYGTAKGALSIFMQGLRQRLAPKGVQVLTIKPGFVDTPMTAQFKKGILWAKPDTIAKAIEKGVTQKKNSLYAPGYWRLIMGIIQRIPEPMFKKMSL